METRPPPAPPAAAPHPVLIRQLRPLVRAWQDAGFLDEAGARRILAGAQPTVPTPAPAATPAPALSRRQVSELLGICERSVDNYARRGVLHPRRVGPHLVRFDPEEVRALYQTGNPVQAGAEA